ncbi:MAG TPA: N-acetylmuramoyl-L-alanine amidase [Patescibacteria group bacterium]|nr:N-acetylmuramoyl-L-alanine amidase [Patescibacteria group bacterium]
MKFYDNKSSPNFDDRAKDSKIEIIVVHYTSMDSTQAVLDKFADPASKVSSHYLIAENGDIYALVPEDKRAWHAGVSSWQGRDDVNSRSIGIEISNRNGEPYTKEQLFALTILIKDIQSRHDVLPENIVGHSDVAPNRKQDPGEHFPWQKLSRHDIGRWPKPTIMDKFNAAAVAKKPQELRALFRAAGYGTEGIKTKDLVTAFQRRYEQDVFNDAAATPGIATEKTVAKLRAVARVNTFANKKPAGPGASAKK